MKTLQKQLEKLQDSDMDERTKETMTKALQAQIAQIEARIEAILQEQKEEALSKQQAKTSGSQTTGNVGNAGNTVDVLI
jgi:hypothetical protein